jgi:hypothetical protein
MGMRGDRDAESARIDALLLERRDGNDAGADGSVG